MISKFTETPQDTIVYEFGEYRLEPEKLLLMKNSEVVNLPPKTIEVLVALVESSGKVLTKQEILDKVWSDTFVEEANLTHHVSALRKALGEGQNGAKFIETIPRRGYRFVYEVYRTSNNASEVAFTEKTKARDVEEIFENDDIAPTKSAIKQNPLPLRESEQAVLRRNRRTTVIAATALAAILVLTAGVFAWRFWQPHPVFFDDSSRARWRTASVIEAKNPTFGEIAHLSFAPGGKFVAFERSSAGKSALHVKQIGGGEPVKLTDGKWLDAYPIWFSDGQRLLFLSNRDNFWGLWTIPFLGGTPALVKRLDIPIATPVQPLKIGRDGERVFLWLDRKLFVLNLNEDQPRLIFESSDKYQDAGDFAVSPDETQFAFSGVSAGESQIFVRSLFGAEEPRQVTSGAGKKRQPAWFPDSQQLAFSSDSNGNFQIYATDASNGGSLRQLTLSGDDHTAPIVSDDGRSILFLTNREEANIYSASLESAGETAHTRSTDLQLFAVVSPDNARVAYQTTTSTINFFKSSLKIQSFDESNQIFEVAREGFAPQWSPDGGSLAFVRDDGSARNIWKVSANGQNETQITRDGINIAGFSTVPFNFDHTNFSFSPDGSQIAYSSSRAGFPDLWTTEIGAAGESKDRRWTNNGAEIGAVKTLFWSPDSKRIAFVLESNPKSAAEQKKYGIAVADGSSVKIPHQSDRRARILGWTAGGLEVLAALREINPQTKEKTIVVVRLRSEDESSEQIAARLPAADLNNIRLSPDSQQIVFAANIENKNNLFVLSLSDNSQPRRLTNNEDATRYYSNAVWSPDGRRIFYSKQTSSASYTLLTIAE